MVGWTSIFMTRASKVLRSSNEWIPVIRAILTAIAIGVIPFLVLFLPTPIVGKAASVLLGFFVFLSTWGVTDAVIHGAAMDYAARGFEEVRQSNLGVYALAAFMLHNPASIDALAVARKQDTQTRV